MPACRCDAAGRRRRARVRTRLGNEAQPGPGAGRCRLSPPWLSPESPVSRNGAGRCRRPRVRTCLGNEAPDQGRKLGDAAHPLVARPREPWPAAH